MFLGIYNGYSGGVAVYDGQKLVAAIPTPTIHVLRASKTKSGEQRKGQEINEAMLAQFIRRYSPTSAVIEMASANPQQGVVSMFSFGVTHGTVRGIVGCLGIPFTLVHSRTWQKEMCGKFAVGESKAQAALTAARMFPEFNFLANERSRVPHEGMIDAALMAVYCSRIHGGKQTAQSFDMEVEEIGSLKPSCTIPPEGWRCTRAADHDGPCAAVKI